jgi:POT family proton-dependent oligopeptide transporter
MIGGLTLCAGHLTLAVHGLIPFYTGLALIVAGVGMLKPNISTMVGGLYPAGDPRRDKGFTIFYIGINIGALLSSIIVGFVGEKIGWHYGFGLAGIGMLAGQAVYILGQKHLAGVGELAGRSQVQTKTATAAAGPEPLTKEDKDRVVVLFLSFLIVIVFWGAFEQAGGLMNIIAKESTDRMLLGFDVPASWFQSLNPLFIIIFGTLVGAYWYRRKLKGGESSSLFKMALGTMIMGSGFVFMVFATLQVESAGKAAMYWLVLAYLFHTIGELCASPVALSFITKLAPMRYASLMMGVYFAVTGLGNKLAGFLGEAAVGGAGKMTVFLGITLFCVAFGVVILLFLKPLNRLTHGAEDFENEENGHNESTRVAEEPVAG